MRAGLGPVYPRLWRFCVVLTRDRTVADDLAQQTCMRALDQADKFQPGTHLDRWVFTIARRLWLNDLRHQKVRTGAGQVPAEEAGLTDPRSDTETNILARQVLEMIQDLPDAQRETVLLVYIEGLRYAEAADMLEVPIGTVMSRLATARKAIAQKAGTLGIKE